MASWASCWWSEYGEWNLAPWNRMHGHHPHSKKGKAGIPHTRQNLSPSWIIELQLLHVTSVRRRAASQNGHISREIIGLLWSELTVVLVTDVSVARRPGVDFVMRLLIEKSLLLEVRVVSVTFIVSGVGSSAGSVLTVAGLMVRGMVVSFTKVGGGAGGEVWWP